ncbi:MAG: hypothetical protein ACK5L6_10055 [Anaerorhabdus sp.]|uniref:hypothetical protein n=1 Tax=Anaerorhabdus sp. TaxID=1872524 RepID=UPI003A87A037
MNIIDAIEIASKENKLLALPHDDKCQETGLRLKLGILNGEFVCYEFYGIERKLQFFTLSPEELIRHDWFII